MRQINIQYYNIAFSNIFFASFRVFSSAYLKCINIKSFFFIINISKRFNKLFNFFLKHFSSNKSVSVRRKDK